MDIKSRVVTFIYGCAVGILLSGIVLEYDVKDGNLSLLNNYSCREVDNE